MKKKLSLLLVLVLMAGVFSGCCLSHDWEKATCVDPRICAKCGETEGEPLDHDWVEASCEAAKTCDRCGKTRGEALGHNVSDWSVAGSQLAGSCTLCGKEVRKEATAEDLGNAQILGHWVGYLMSNGDEDYDLEDYDDIYITFYDDGTLTGKLLDTDCSGTWAYDKETDGGTLYTVMMNGEEFSGAMLEDDKNYVCLMQGDYMLIYTRP